ncbi:MAG: hypothetical protein IPF47_13880 [Gemmatimonadetes bacterium]|nr:hypothetical protein [Gemmatimonadota bacterium]
MVRWRVGHWALGDLATGASGVMVSFGVPAARRGAVIQRPSAWGLSSLGAVPFAPFGTTSTTPRA